MGCGSSRLAVDQELRSGIEAAGWRLRFEEIEAVDESQAEIARVIALLRRLAERTRRATATGAFPLVLAGDCNSCLGTVAGVGADQLGVIWFDAHADFDDPEENLSGFFDVMGLAMLTGRGWRALRETIPGHRPVAERDVILAGVRDLEPYQRERLERSNVQVVPDLIDLQRFERALSELASRVSRIYLHVDLDALDSSEGQANAYAAPGGPSLARLLECVRAACARFSVVGAAITAYDPAVDVDSRILTAGRRIAAEIAAGVQGRDSSTSRATTPSRSIGDA